MIAAPRKACLQPNSRSNHRVPASACSRVSTSPPQTRGAIAPSPDKTTTCYYAKHPPAVLPASGYKQTNCIPYVALELTMTLTTTDGTPRICIQDRKRLHPTRGERSVELVLECGWLFPCMRGVSKKHAQHMPCA